MNEMNVLLRKPDVRTALGCSNATIYTRIREKLLTPPIKIGKRSSAWPKSEINAIIAARIAGHGDDVIKALVTRLVEDRKAEGTSYAG